MFELSEAKLIYYLNILDDLFQDLVHQCGLKINKYNILKFLIFHKI